jgi:hypothetical protein
MATVVESATAMGTRSSVEAAVAASVEPAALEAVGATASMEAFIAAEFMISVPTAFAAEPVMIAKSIMIPVPTAPIVSAPSAIVSAPVEAMEPRARPNEHAARKIVSSIVAIRGARIRSIRVVAVRAIGRRPHVHRRWHRPNAYAKPHRHLSMSSSSSRDQREKPHCECIFEISHFPTSWTEPRSLAIGPQMLRARPAYSTRRIGVCKVRANAEPERV